MFTYIITINLKQVEDGFNYQNVSYYAGQVTANEFTYGDQYRGPVSLEALYEWNFYSEAPQALLTVSKDRQNRVLANRLYFFDTPDPEREYYFNSPVFVKEPPSARNIIQILPDKENRPSEYYQYQNDVPEKTQEVPELSFYSLYR